ncbi:Acyl-CoA--sterol O-acyltransferase 1 [Linum perenne]
MQSSQTTSMDTNKELRAFINVWSTIFVSLSFCHFMGKLVLNSPRYRLLFVAPVVSLFLFLPLTLRSVHLIGVTSFFISWLANFKLLLFAFHRGPLSSSSSLLHFIIVACMPLKVSSPPHPPWRTSEKLNRQARESYKWVEKSQKRSDTITTNQIWSKENLLNYIVKALIYTSLSWVYELRSNLHPIVLMFVYFNHVYYSLEIFLTISNTVARLAISSDLEPPFNKPYLSTSLQDFWGRRWNVMVSSIMRLAIYDPVLMVLKQVMGLQTAQIVAVWTTFIVSGLMHELIFYYLGRQRPTWEVLCFFLVHGTCLLAEVYLKKAAKERNSQWWPLPNAVANVTTMGFVTVMTFWLFFPPLIRCGVDVRAVEEYVTTCTWIKELFMKIIFYSYY